MDLDEPFGLSTKLSFTNSGIIKRRVKKFSIEFGHILIQYIHYVNLIIKIKFPRKNTGIFNLSSAAN